MLRTKVNRMAGIQVEVAMMVGDHSTRCWDPYHELMRLKLNFNVNRNS